jgi:hypothetical protein
MFRSSKRSSSGSSLFISLSMLLILKTIKIFKQYYQSIVVMWQCMFSMPLMRTVWRRVLVWIKLKKFDNIWCFWISRWPLFPTMWQFHETTGRKLCYEIYIYIYLTAIGLTPGGSSTVHIYTQTVPRTTQLTQTIHRTTQLTNWEECWTCPIFASYTLAFAL